MQVLKKIDIKSISKDQEPKIKFNKNSEIFLNPQKIKTKFQKILEPENILKKFQKSSWSPKKIQKKPQENPKARKNIRK